MSRRGLRDKAEFRFSKVKLTSNTNKSNTSKTQAVQCEKKDSNITTVSPPIHKLDFLTLAIPFICLFSVTVIICLVNFFKTTWLSSSTSVPVCRYRKAKHNLGPDIHIIEPTISVAAREFTGNNEVQNVSEAEFVYLRTLLK